MAIDALNTPLPCRRYFSHRKVYIVLIVLITLYRILAIFNHHISHDTLIHAVTVFNNDADQKDTITFYTNLTRNQSEQLGSEMGYSDYDKYHILAPSPNSNISQLSEKNSAKKSALEEIEECGCPKTEIIQNLMSKWGNTNCRLSNCTDFELDVSDLEKPDYPFNRYDGVVVVTKVHYSAEVAKLQQMICLFNAAYNRHAGYYDIVVFTTLPWTAQQVNELQNVAFPANLTVVVDSPPLENILASMTQEDAAFLKKRCGCSNRTLTWFHHCTEPNSKHVANLGYSWQSEFRTYHLWKEPSLANYKYMIWMDSDAYPTKNWNIDPMKVMVDNDLVLMYDNFPRGRGTVELKTKIMKAYNQSLCGIKLAHVGYLEPKICAGRNNRFNIELVHGFHHITNMDFYRSERTMSFLKSLIEEYKFIRKLDDQMAVTIPAAMDAPNRSWDYRKNGLEFSIVHNGNFDGDTFKLPRAYNKFHWQLNRHNWTAGAKMCNPYVVGRGF